MSSLSDRMKTYEDASQYKFTPLMPVVIRIKCANIDSVSRSFRQPFDNVFHKTMRQTARALGEAIPNCFFAYTYSDEVNLLVTDYNTNNKACYNNNMQKIVSMSSSIATVMFNKFFAQNVSFTDKTRWRYTGHLNEAIFESKAFIIPKEELVNYFVWRQYRGFRHTIDVVAGSEFSSEELKGKTLNQKQDMLLKQKEIDINRVKPDKKHGFCVFLTTNGWVIDLDIPLFSKNKEYIEKFL